MSDNLNDPDTCQRIAAARGLERVLCDECDGDGLIVIGSAREPSSEDYQMCESCHGTGYQHEGGECGHDAPLVQTPWDPALLICERCAVVCERCEDELCRVVVCEPGGGERRLCVHCLSAENESESPAGNTLN